MLIWLVAESVISCHRIGIASAECLRLVWCGLKLAAVIKSEGSTFIPAGTPSAVTSVLLAVLVQMDFAAKEDLHTVAAFHTRQVMGDINEDVFLPVGRE